MTADARHMDEAGKDSPTETLEAVVIDVTILIRPKALYRIRVRAFANAY